MPSITNPSACAVRFVRRRPALRRWWWLAGLLVVAAPPAPAQVASFAAAPSGWVEAGVPLFDILTPQAMGLSSPPTEMHELPDGRILLVAQRQIAFGDGTRWDVYSQADPAAGNGVSSVLAAADGNLYAGTGAGFARLDIGADGKWRLQEVTTVDFPPGTRPPGRLVAVTTDAGSVWHGSSGSVVEWEPGRKARLIGATNAVEHVFAFRGALFVADRADGTLLRKDGEQLAVVVAKEEITPDDAITCSAAYDAEHLLVGTHGNGLKIFDGRQWRPIIGQGALAGGNRINALCATEGGLFAAAVERVGVVFFDRRGRTVQQLDAAVDARLARPQRLLAGAGGVVWVLLPEGLARVQFPARVSSFEPLLASGVTIAMPFRIGGRLWLLADGKLQRGIYDETNRLVRFEADNPGSAFVFALSEWNGRPVAGAADGLFVRDDDGWRCVARELRNARLLPVAPRLGRSLYVARGEIGWIDCAAGGGGLHRIPAPGMGDVYGARVDRDGDVWIELGASAAARVRWRESEPTIERFGAADGLADGWVQVFAIDGRIRFNVGGSIWRFDETTRRFVVDDEFVRRFGLSGEVIGRPARDARGRLWITTNGRVEVIDDSAGTPRRLGERILGDFQPYYFTAEDDGVMWMHENRRLARFDPAMPGAPEPALRAMITRVQVTRGGRTIVPSGGRIARLSHLENSLVIHFVAPGCPINQPVSFDVMLEGSGRGWVAAGAGGSAVFDQLGAGDYILRVRPRTEGGAGEEARLVFTVAPAWYRTNVAYAAYAAGLLGLIAGVAWLTSLLLRHDRERLSRLVAVRTEELHLANRNLQEQVRETVRKAAELQQAQDRARALNDTLQAQVEETTRQAKELQVSEERYRRLSGELEARVAERTRELHATNEQLLASVRELEAFSYSISHDLRAPLRNISGFADLLRRRLEGRVDPDGERQLATIASEAVRLGRLIDSLLAFSRLSRADLRIEPLDLGRLCEEVRRELLPAQAGRAVEWRVGALPVVPGDATLLRQVFLNLLDNALKFTRDRRPAVIEIGATRDEQGRPGVFVRDNGAGFDPRYAAKLFGVFQRLHNPKEFEGCGIGLANVHRIVARHGGLVWAEGRPGEGATFYFSLPAGG